MDQQDSVSHGLCWNFRDHFIYHTFMDIFTQAHNVSFWEIVLKLLLGFRFRLIYVLFHVNFGDDFRMNDSGE